MLIHLDESGDLGWKFDAPYRRGGSSRHLTIASVLVDRQKKHLPKRLIVNMYKKFSWPAEKEMKWSDMDQGHREWFAKKALDMKNQHKDHVKYVSITAKKENVMDHIRADPNKLYNYMIGLSLIKEMSAHEEVIFIPDARSVKVGSGRSLHDYLQTKLWFDKNSKTVLKTMPSDSAANRSLQFSDMLSGVVQGHFEDNSSSPWNILKSEISHRELYF